MLQEDTLTSPQAATDLPTRTQAHPEPIFRPCRLNDEPKATHKLFGGRLLSNEPTTVEFRP